MARSINETERNGSKTHDDDDEVMRTLPDSLILMLLEVMGIDLQGGHRGT